MSGPSQASASHSTAPIHDPSRAQSEDGRQARAEHEQRRLELRVALEVADAGPAGEVEATRDRGAPAVAQARQEPGPKPRPEQIDELPDRAPAGRLLRELRVQLAALHRRGRSHQRVAAQPHPAAGRGGESGKRRVDHAVTPRSSWSA
jgi:hypothetical protein